jgi:hypothetical protein
VPAAGAKKNKIMADGTTQSTILNYYYTIQIQYYIFEVSRTLDKNDSLLALTRQMIDLQTAGQKDRHKLSVKVNS